MEHLSLLGMPALAAPLLLLLLLASCGAADLTDMKCQRITSPICNDIGYNYTYMPNGLGDETQSQAALRIVVFWPLVETKCSPELRFFLCTEFYPFCSPTYISAMKEKKTGVQMPLKSCRSLCERVKAGCVPVMHSYGYRWPEFLSCDRLLDKGQKGTLCIDETQSSESTVSPASKPASGSVPALNGISDSDVGVDGVKPGLGSVTKVKVKQPQDEQCSCKCRPPLLQLPVSHAHYNKVHTAGVPNCAIACEGAFFLDKDKDKRFATVWLGVWSILCAVSSTLTVLTFLMDTRRFSYPERPIVMLSACYMMVSAGYIIRLAVGHEQLACDGRALRYGSSGPWLCTLVFLLTYMFGMASCVWWVVLCVAWFLAAGLKWSREAIAKYSEVFHCVAWFLPVAKFILVLTFSLVDGDPVSGLCSVGNTNLTALRVFVLLPMIVYLLTGSAFLLTGFAALFRIRSAIKQQASVKPYKLEKLMIRIGIFSILYTVPACVVIACHFYESQLRDEWLQAKACRCEAAAKQQQQQQQLQQSEPEYGVFMLRQFMQLAVGITSGVWVWSSKTLATWSRCFGRVFCCQPSGHQQQLQLQQQQQHQLLQQQPLQPDAQMHYKLSLNSALNHMSQV